MRTLHVLALATPPSIGAANRLRVEQYIPLLRDHGIELDVSSFFDEATYRWIHQPGLIPEKALAVVAGTMRRVRDVLRVREYDLLLVHRESMPVGPPLIEALLGPLDRPYVFDFDDAIFLGQMHPANRRWSWLRDPSRVARAVRGAAAVVTSNDYLATWARELNDDVTVIPTPVDTARHLPRPPHEQRPRTVIGWVGSSTTSPYLSLLDEPLARLAAHHDVVLRVVGGHYVHPTAPVEVWPYRVDDEPADLATFDIGVLPQPDDEWTRGKAAYKALLYMATAIPVVASIGGVNAQVVRDGSTGFCVNGTDGWVSALERLAVDPASRQRFGDAGRRDIESRYALSVLAPRLAEVLRRAARAA